MCVYVYLLWLVNGRYSYLEKWDSFSQFHSFQCMCTLENCLITKRALLKKKYYFLQCSVLFSPLLISSTFYKQIVILSLFNYPPPPFTSTQWMIRKIFWKRNFFSTWKWEILIILLFMNLKKYLKLFLYIFFFFIFFHFSQWFVSFSLEKKSCFIFSSLPYTPPPPA